MDEKQRDKTVTENGEEIERNKDREGKRDSD